MQFTRGHLIAIGATALISVWMLSGIGNKEPEITQAPVTQANEDLFAVQVQTFNASDVTPELVINGETSPSRMVALTSEVSGKVIQLHAREGDFVKKGELIVEIDPQDKPQLLRQAKAQLKQRELEFKGNKTLLGKGLLNETQLAESQSMLEAAKAQVRALEIQLSGTKVKAPYSGILENRMVELGTYLRSGDPIIEVLDYNPFLIKGFAAEKDLHLLQTGRTAKGVTLNGTEHSGVIRYVSSQSSKASRTFAVELEINNPNERQADGVTADIRIPLQSTKAIFVSPALLSLNETGILGAKYVIGQQVAFSPVELVKAEASGVWISGLPNPVDLIIAGHSFVSPGEKVRPVFKKVETYSEDDLAKQTSSQSNLQSNLQTNTEIAPAAEGQ